MPVRDPVELVISTPDEERGFWLHTLAPDDAADLIQGAANRSVLHFSAFSIHGLGPMYRHSWRTRKAKPETFMSPRLAKLRPDTAIDEAITYLRRQAGQVEPIYYAYVLDDEQRLLGIGSLRDILSAPRYRRVRSVMRTRFQTVREMERQEAITKLIADHRLLAPPVVNAFGIMKGIFTIGDAMQAACENADQQLQRVGGMEVLGGPYSATRFATMIRKRAGWLSGLFLGEMLAATAMGFFQQEIARAVVLALFVPLIISSGGNSGSQAATLVIRAMSLDEVRLTNVWRVFKREMAAGLGLGSVLCALGVARILLWLGIWGSCGEQFARVALTVGVSLVGVVLFGNIAGATLPLLLRFCRVDPATASAPAVATLVDVTGLILSLSVAKLFILGVLP